MHPGFFGWWQRSHHGHCGPHAAHAQGGWHGGPPHGGPPHRHGHGDFGGGEDGDFGGGPFGGGPFGVRRPLRFLAFKLGLRDEQVAELATILNELKTERAQAAVDNRRATAAFADALASDAFDEAKASELAASRVKSAERLQQAVSSSFARIHAILDGEQRKQLAYLIRTGVLAI